MYRSSRLARRRALEWLGIGAAVLVLGWPAGSAPFAPSAPRPAAAPMSLAAAGRPAAVGPPTLTVYPASATASDPMTALAFTYTANLVQDGTLTITVPPGWTPPVTTNAIGCTVATQGTVTTSGQTIVISDLSLAGNTSAVIIYGATAGSNCSLGDAATAGSTSGTNIFTAEEMSTAGGTLTTIAVSPTVTVN